MFIQRLDQALPIRAPDDFTTTHPRSLPGLQTHTPRERVARVVLAKREQIDRLLTLVHSAHATISLALTFKALRDDKNAGMVMGW
jgi:hypothetical protein